MTRHRTTRSRRLSKRPTHDNADPTPSQTAAGRGREYPDVDATLYVTTDSLGKADAFIASAERLIAHRGVGIERADEDEHDENSYGHGDDDDPGRLRNNLAHLIESTKLAVRAAQYAHSQTVDAIEGYYAASNRTVEVTTAITKHEGRP